VIKSTIKKIQSSYIFNNHKIVVEWIKNSHLTKYSPITQVYGIVFNKKGEILICREKSQDKWQIPGGHPEKGESLGQTLKRELEEEVNVKIRKIRPLGVQKVKFLNNPDRKEGDLFFQARYFAILDKLLPQAPDPASGSTWERKFVSANKITQYIKWGKTGKTIFDDALKAFLKYIVD